MSYCYDFSFISSARFLCTLLIYLRGAFGVFDIIRPKSMGSRMSDLLTLLTLEPRSCRKLALRAISSVPFLLMLSRFIGCLALSEDFALLRGTWVAPFVERGSVAFMRPPSVRSMFYWIRSIARWVFSLMGLSFYGDFAALPSPNCSSYFDSYSLNLCCIWLALACYAASAVNFFIFSTNITSSLASLVFPGVVNFYFF